MVWRGCHRETRVPGTGYDTEAQRIGSVRTGKRPLHIKLALLAAFAASVMVGGLLAAILR